MTQIFRLKHAQCSILIRVSPNVVGFPYITHRISQCGLAKICHFYLNCLPSSKDVEDVVISAWSGLQKGHKFLPLPLIQNTLKGDFVSTPIKVELVFHSLSLVDFGNLINKKQ